MKTSSISILLFCASVIASNPPLFFDGSQSQLVAKSNDVPGDNPLVFCSDPTDYILNIDYVNLKPNPPIPGENLTVEAIGTLTEDVEAGTKLFLTVKYNAVTLLAQEVDLCDQIPNVDLSCPIKKGPLNVTKTVEVPSMVPQGKYVVAADVYTEGHKDVITCLEGTAVFA